MIVMCWYEGVVSTVAGSGLASYADGAATTTALNNPKGVAVDSNGVIYISDWGDYRIRMLQTTGTCEH